MTSDKPTMLDSGLVPQLGQTVQKSISTLQARAEATTSKFLEQADEVISKISLTTERRKKSQEKNKNKGMQFAPVKIPLARRRQTFAVFMYTSMLFLCLGLNFLALRYWEGVYFYMYITYIGWKLVFQIFHRNGGLPIPWFRKCFLWQWFVEYFPVTLHKIVSLDPSDVYIFGLLALKHIKKNKKKKIKNKNNRYHPHGIIGMGAWAAFACQAAGWEQLFPGVDVRLVTLKLNFFIPFFDLFLTFMGVCDASKEGAKESLDAHHGDVTLFLAERKGFVKVALVHGASLVPVFGFGENDLYSQVSNPKGSFIRKLQEKLQQRLGFAIPIFRGRGVFQYNFGLLPNRIPIDIVFGEPIKCPKLMPEEITKEIIDKYHKEYMMALKELFDAYKEKFYHESQLLPKLHFK
ncbi:hypothetical protein RFI_08505 [Reticulomyxa filosa]|uniref:Acyltransferase n=1 Tax=Reticulomyxa filosa TaxID=46433 RepID=X6NQQ4_RETFI|nr:hypothetical protein RFI_08505 [Reticulomyxa filosa]|eukprot:ETO28625.1 hypothetical protein RFI_08505 [Reticulomyxa filosa]